MSLPKGFVYLQEVVPGIIQDVKYCSTDNFIGRKIVGYESPVCILTEKAALRLAWLQQQLNQKGLGLKVFDCYRPQVAVDEFVAWSQDETDQLRKADYYPRVDKADFFKLGYLMTQSGHTRGSTVDLTLVSYTGKKRADELPMGTHFDFMDPLSHPLTGHVDAQAKQNRLYLRSVMFEAGFKAVATEWWHFTLIDEPFPDVYFNFPVS